MHCRYRLVLILTSTILLAARCILPHLWILSNSFERWRSFGDQTKFCFAYFRRGLTNVSHSCRNNSRDRWTKLLLIKQTIGFAFLTVPKYVFRSTGHCQRSFWLMTRIVFPSRYWCVFPMLLCFLSVRTWHLLEWNLRCQILDHSFRALMSYWRRI